MLLKENDIRVDVREAQEKGLDTTRNIAQALINTRIRTEQALETKDLKSLDFFKKDIPRRLGLLVKELDSRGWLQNIPKNLDLGYIKDELSDDYDDDIPLRLKLFFFRTFELKRVRAYRQQQFFFFGKPVERIDKFHLIDCEEDDWLRTGPVDIYLLSAIPENMRDTVISPYFIPIEVKNKILLS